MLSLLQVISQVPALGEVTVQSLADIQGQAFDKPLVLICEKLGGMEVSGSSGGSNSGSSAAWTKQLCV